MSIPPQIIRVKRKIIEEPLDALYFESNSEASHDAKRPFTDYAFKLLHRKLPAGPTNSVKHNTATASNNAPAQVPKLRGETLLPEDDKLTQQARDWTQGARSSKTIQPRRFHLSRAAKKDIETVLRARQQNNNKVTKHPWPNTPVFAELRTLRSPSKQERLQKQVIQTNEMQDQQMIDEALQAHQNVSSQKKPRTRDGSKRDEQQQRQDEPMQETVEVDPSVLRIFAEMQEEYENGVTSDSESENKSRAPKTRFKPKVPAQRYREQPKQVVQPSEQDDSMKIDASRDNDYVYDTYIRYRTDLTQWQVGHESPENGTYGILVIDEDDQPLWEEFIDDEEGSEKDWNSEDEDENAEDFYGADYPEEEVDVDDEYDTGAYNYRYNASDDEQYDSETIAWSDEEELRYPWKASARAKPETYESDSDEEHMKRDQ
ncbi:MAG: hypothetical protein M1822_007616 [Bathelium mastoideum]|nr:MAG: hypothetical protein M1822_007616 [Bathelium mastoideum]